MPGTSIAKRLASTSLVAVLFLGALADDGRAQLTRVGEIVLGSPGDSIVGVEVGDSYAYCSLFDSGAQAVVDVFDPSAPALCATLDPPLNDQFGDPLLVEGMLVTGHRFGGVNLIDVSSPCSPATLATAATTYHFKGLRALRQGPALYLFYSDHNSGGAPGGLLVFDMAAGALTPLGARKSVDLDGGALAVRSAGDFAFQLDPGRREGTAVPISLNVYDVSDKSNPGLAVEHADLGNVLALGRNEYDMELSAGESHLFVACGGDGLKVVDVTVPSNPIVVRTVSRAGVEIEGLAFYNRAKTLLCVTIRLANGKTQLVVLNVANPTQPLLVSSDKISGITDVDCDDGLVYVTLQDETNRPVLRIYF